VTLRVHQRLILWGFVLAYFGVMGALVAPSFGEYEGVAIKFVLIPAGIVGCALITIAKLSHVPSE
jgi:hypothetical protein